MRRTSTIAPNLAGDGDSDVTTGTRYAIDDAVFVDRYGRRRRVVIAAGVVVAAVLLVWLALMGMGVVAAVVVPTGQPGPAVAGDPPASV
jgi:hypothetical protein